MTDLMKVIQTSNVKIDGFFPLGTYFTFCFLPHSKIHSTMFVHGYLSHPCKLACVQKWHRILPEH